MELISYFYTPTPQRSGTYGDVDPTAGTPETLEEWIEPEWVDWMTHENPAHSVAGGRLKARVDDFELVLKSRFPSVHDKRTKAWGKALGRIAARRRWAAAKVRRSAAAEENPAHGPHRAGRPPAIRAPAAR